MGQVYKITFPCGRFYIGATDNILQRISAHYVAKSAVGDLVRENDMTRDSLMDAVTFLYDGGDYKSEETKAIDSYRNSTYILNKQFPPPLHISSGTLCFDEIYKRNQKYEPNEPRRSFIRRATNMYPNDLLLVSCDKLQRRIVIVRDQSLSSVGDIYLQLTKMEAEYPAKYKNKGAK